jgi:hypothetical protein
LRVPAAGAGGLTMGVETTLNLDFKRLKIQSDEIAVANGLG